MRAADMRARYGNISGSSAATGLSTQHGEDDSKYAKPQQAVEPLAQEQEVHLLRKLFHIGWGVFFVMLRHSMMRRLTKYDRIIGLLLSAAVFFETARMHYPGFNRFVRQYFGPLMRRSEQDRFSGIMYYLLGVYLVSRIAAHNFLVFDAAIANLAIGDPMASLGGIIAQQVFGAVPLKNGKTVAGFVVGWMCSFGSLVAVYALTKEARREMALLGFHGEAHRLSLALFGGLVGAAAELAVPSPAPRLDSKTFPLALDDNFIVPLISCIVIQTTVDHMQEDNGGMLL